MKTSAPPPFLRIGSGPPLLLLHPFATTWRSWQPVAQILSKDFDVFAPTMPGHFGGPQPKRADFTGMFADAVGRMMDSIGWDKVHIAGNSLGGWVALDLARRGRATGVTAFAPAGGWHKRTPAAFRLGLSFLPWHPVVHLGQRWALPLMRSPARRHLLLKWVFEHGEMLSPEDAAHFVEGVAGCSIYLELIRQGFSNDGIEGMNEVKCPVHLVFSECDHVIPLATYGGRFLRELPHATNEILPGVGHCPQLEVPEKVSAIIRRNAVGRVVWSPKVAQA